MNKICSDECKTFAGSGGKGAKTVSVYDMHKGKWENRTGGYKANRGLDMWKTVKTQHVCPHLAPAENASFVKRVSCFCVLKTWYFFVFHRFTFYT